MRDRELYATLLGIEAPWQVAAVDPDLQQGEVVVHVEHAGGPVHCPRCGQTARHHDARQRRWRQADTCQYRTYLAAKVPRVRCAEHGVLELAVPWSEVRSRLPAQRQ